MEGDSSSSPDGWLVSISFVHHTTTSQRGLLRVQIERDSPLIPNSVHLGTIIMDMEPRKLANFPLILRAVFV